MSSSTYKVSFDDPDSRARKYQLLLVELLSTCLTYLAIGLAAEKDGRSDYREGEGGNEYLLLQRGASGVIVICFWHGFVT